MVQTMVPDELRGRAMGVYTLMFFGGMPLGSLLIGSMAELLTEPVTLAINAAIVLLVVGLSGCACRSFANWVMTLACACDTGWVDNGLLQDLP